MMNSNTDPMGTEGMRKRQGESGLPLGGIGAGSIEFCSDGRFTNITTNNNWDVPIVDSQAKAPQQPRIKEGFAGSVEENHFRRRSIFAPEGLPGAWLAIHSPGLGARVLKTVARPAFVPIEPEAIEFQGRFPYARVAYRGLDPIQLELEAFSPFSLPDASEGYLNSSLPLALFHFRVLNLSDQPTPVTLVFSWQNINGLGGYPHSPINEPDLTSPTFREDDFAPGVFFGHADQSTSDLRVLGDYTLRGRTDFSEASVSYCLGWDPSGDGRDVWDPLAREGSLGNRALPGVGGALAFRLSLMAGQQGSAVFALAWNMPHLLAAVDEYETLVRYSSPPADPRWVPDGKERADYGHAYNRWFEDSWQVAEHGLRDWEGIRQRLFDWQNALSASNAPDFFVEAACNDLFPLYSNSWYTLDGKYAINEAPTDMKGCLGTIDQRAVANAAVACAYPDLDRSELELFAADQIMAEDDPRRFGFHWDTTNARFNLRLDREGAILHDIGWDHLEGGRIGRLGWLSTHWPDLTSVFVLQVYQHGIWNGATDWLEAMYPHIQAALRFQARLDQNKNGVPDLWGSGCCTYDTELYPYYGASSFVVSLYLAALKAAERLAQDFGDTEYARELDERLAAAQRVMEQVLWHEELGYYRSWVDPDYQAWESTPEAHGAESLNCHIGQLAGAWWADLLGLGPIIDPDRRRRTLESIARLNVDPISGCPANEVAPGGEYSESWPLYTLAYYSALAISAGLPDEGWRAVEKIYRVRQELDGSHWDTPLEYAGENNEAPQWGRWYMSTPASWYLWIALSGVRLDRLHSELSLSPSWPQEWGDRLSGIPVFLPGLQLTVDCRSTPSSWSYGLRIERMLSGALTLDRIVAQIPQHFNPTEDQVKVDGMHVSRLSLTPAGRLILEGPFTFEKPGDGFTLEVQALVG